MSSRLKRKLNDLGVDPSSSKANESFCLIGTPLPPLEKSKDTGEFVPLWKQDVRDEKGRRRLHGAFTGGFSAGYFNTVGSKEGWTPSTFVSSRSDRAKARAVRAEDFMDEEDLAELRESRKLVDEHEEMDFGGTESELKRRAGAAEPEKDDITAALEASLAPAPNDSVGARILKKMGWRVGQGIGPRLTYSQRRAELGPNAPKEEEEPEEAKKHVYPRRDTRVLIAPRKDTFHGLGYAPGMSLEEAVARDERQGPEISAGFGLGALNDADEDDLDVYDSGKGIGRGGRTRMAYELADDDDMRITVGPSSSRRGARKQALSVTPAGMTQTFNDGRPVLKGFVLSDRPVAEDGWFPLPEVPQGWAPNPRRVWEEGDKDKENAGQGKAGQIPPGKIASKPHAEWRDSFMSADERGSMLGEAPLPSQPRSVFDYLSQKDRKRLRNIKNAALETTPAPSAPQSPSQAHVPSEVVVPTLHPSIAKAALAGFQPFVTDPVKHSRYTAFLNYQADRESAGGSSGLGIGPTPGQSIEGFNKELEDYAKSASVFKPLSGAMAGRFRSAAIVEAGPDVVEGLHRPVSAPEPKAEEAKKEDDDPRMGAVRMGIFGPLTREVRSWQPARLLCKRFGVKDPEVDMTGEAGAATADFAMPTAAAKHGDAGAAGSAGAAAPESKFVSAGAIMEAGDLGSIPRRNGPRDFANVGLGEDEDQGRDTLTYERPAMDIFKAIFASDEEDSDEDEEAGGEAEKMDDPTPKTGVAVKTESAPSHLAVSDSVRPTYEPNATAVGAATEKVDLTTFKPTFVPRGERELKKDKSKDKDKKDKKKSKAALLTFDIEEDSAGLGAPPSSRHKEKRKAKREDKDEQRKRKKKEQQPVDNDDTMWVEAPPPEALKSIPMEALRVSGERHLKPNQGVEMPSPEHEESRGPRTRKRAIDFM